MKKINYNLEENKKRIKALAPTFEPYVCIIAFCLSALVLDLEKIFNFDLTYTKGVLSSAFFYGLIYTLAWVVDSLIYCIIEKRRKKQKKEVENEN